MDAQGEMLRLQNERDAARKLAARYAAEAAGRKAGCLESAVVDIGNRGGEELDVREGAVVVIHPGDRGTRNVTLDEWVKEIRARSPHLWPEEEGKDTGGGKAGNPWAKDTWNLTGQGRIARDTPALARQMAAAAGKTLNL